MFRLFEPHVPVCLPPAMVPQDGQLKVEREKCDHRDP